MMKNKRLEIKDRDGNVISFKKFKAANKEELLTHAVAKKQLISDGTFTRSKLQKLVEEKKLHEITFADEIYFERDEVANYLKNWIDKKNSE